MLYNPYPLACATEGVLKQPQVLMVLPLLGDLLGLLSASWRVAGERSGVRKKSSNAANADAKGQGRAQASLGSLYIGY